MAKHLTEHIVEQIVQLIDLWDDDSLTWPRLVEAIEANLGLRYSRQSLCKYKMISDAFQLRKQGIRENKGVDPIYRSKQMQDAVNTIEEQKRTIARLEKQVNDLLEQFLRWSYNATHACKVPITLNDLNKPLPPKN